MHQISCLSQCFPGSVAKNESWRQRCHYRHHSIDISLSQQIGWLFSSSLHERRNRCRLREYPKVVSDPSLLALSTTRKPAPKENTFTLFLAFAPAPGPCPILPSKELQWASLISASTRFYAVKGACVAGFLVAEVMLKMPFSPEFSVSTEQLRQG